MVLKQCAPPCVPTPLVLGRCARSARCLAEAVSEVGKQRGGMAERCGQMARSDGQDPELVQLRSWKVRTAVM
jgi:hypothetical protein